MSYKGKSTGIISGRNCVPNRRKGEEKGREIYIKENCPSRLFFHLKLYENIMLGVAEAIWQS